MEDQGKRLLLAVGIIAVLFVVWTFLFPPKAPPRQAAPPPPTPAATTAPVAGGAAPAPATGAPAAAGAPGAPAEAPPAPVACVRETEGAPRWDTPEYLAVFSRCGGTVASFTLKGDQFRAKSPDGQRVQMDLVRTGADPLYYPLQTPVMVAPPGSTNPDEKRTPVVPDRATWELVSASADEVVYSFTSADRALRIEKKFTRLPTKFGLKLDFSVKNVSEKAGDKRLVETSLLVFGHQDPNVRDPSMFHYAEPTWGSACYANGELKHDPVKEIRNETHSATGDVRWTGADHPYFLLAVAPLEREQQTCARSVVPGTAGIMKEELSWGIPSALEPSQEIKHSVAVYSGPKLMEQLQAVSKVVGQDTKLEQAIDLGWLAVLCKPMLFLLKLFHGWVSNWGVSIIMLTVVVKLLTLYWTQKSMRSMKAMSKLKPEMDKIKEKFPEDKQRQNTEMMNLYKTHKISPFGGCLPLLLQMPIWFALYRTLAKAADLYQAPFAGWIQDLTAPDPYYVIPIVLTALMFVQAKISPASMDSQQQKIMQWMMPIMMGVFSLLFPAGLGIYMITNTLLGMGHQYYMNKTDPGRLVVATPAPAPSAATSSTASSPKPGERGPRPPKNRKNVAKARG